MSKGKPILGHIDCPTCGTAKGMRITHDKNGDPFGFCEAECNQQMRIGGDKRRVRAFLARFPWAAGQAAPAPAPAEPTRYEKHRAIATAPAPAPVKAKAPAPAPVAAAPAAPRSAFADAMRHLGVA